MNGAIDKFFLVSSKDKDLSFYWSRTSPTTLKHIQNHIKSSIFHYSKKNYKKFVLIYLVIPIWNDSSGKIRENLLENKLL